MTPATHWQTADAPEIEGRRALADARAYAEANRDAINAEWDALPNWPRTIAQHLATPLGRAMVQICKEDL